MKKMKKPGDNISMKMKKNEAPAVLDWINSQTNLVDSIRYLIENEVRHNGIRNLQHTIPSVRPEPVPLELEGSLPAPTQNPNVVRQELAMPSSTAEVAAAQLPSITSVNEANDVEINVDTRTHDDNKEEPNVAEESRTKRAEVEIDDEDIESWL